MTLPLTDSGPLIVIDDLERRAREMETEAAQCREAAALMRRLYGVSTVGAVALVLPPPITFEGASGHRFIPPSGEPKSDWTSETTEVKAVQRTHVPRAENAVRVLAALGQSEGFERIGVVINRLEPVPVRYGLVKAILQSAVREGTVESTGKGSATRYRLSLDPKMTASGLELEIVAQNEPKEIPAVVTNQIVSIIGQQLASGASYTAAYMLREVRRTLPVLSEARLQSVVDDLVTAGRLERIGMPKGSETRYRRTAHWKAKASA